MRLETSHAAPSVEPPIDSALKTSSSLRESAVIRKRIEQVERRFGSTVPPSTLADLRVADEELAFWALSLAERDVLTSKRSLGTISSKTDRSGTSASKRR